MARTDNRRHGGKRQPTDPVENGFGHDMGNTSFLEPSVLCTALLPIKPFDERNAISPAEAQPTSRIWHSRTGERTVHARHRFRQANHEPQIMKDTSGARKIEKKKKVHEN